MLKFVYFISTWNYENRVSKHFVISLNSPGLIAGFFSKLFAYVFFFGSFCDKKNKSLATGTGSWESNELGESNIASS